MTALFVSAFWWLLIIWAAVLLAFAVLFVVWIREGRRESRSLRADLDATLDHLLGADEREASARLYSTTDRRVVGVQMNAPATVRSGRASQSKGKFDDRRTN